MSDHRKIFTECAISEFQPDKINNIPTFVKNYPVNMNICAYMDKNTLYLDDTVLGEYPTVIFYLTDGDSIAWVYPTIEERNADFESLIK